MFGRERVEMKSLDQIRLMRKAGLVVSEALSEVRDAARPGLSLLELNSIAEAAIRDRGAVPSFLGYEGFPASICTSVNDEVIHGIPSARVLEDGDVLSIDCGAILDGWHGDSAITLLVGEAHSAAVRALDAATERSMWAGLAAVASAKYVNGIGLAIEGSLEDSGEQDGVEYGIVEDYVGHGIGTSMHQPPDVVNFWTKEKGPRVRPGLCLAIEPMVTLGSPETTVLDDDWTVVTADSSIAAHWEHTVAVTESGICVLTASDGGLAGLAPFGVTPISLD
jgi:methionyl aminopeptidase